MGIGLGITVSGATNLFSPLSLFPAGSKGVWYDPSRLTTLFQDTAGTVPVTAAGQSVALIRDLSGNGFHAGQTTAGQRPVYQIDGSGRPYLAFDGADDGLESPSFSWGSDAATLIVGAEKDQDGALGYLVDFNDYGGGVAGSFALRVPGSPTAAVGFSSRGGTSAALAAVFSANYDAPKKVIVTGIGSTSASLSYVIANRTDAASATQAQGAVAYGTSILRMGGRVSNPTVNPFLGRLYGFIAVNYQMSTETQLLAESWMNAKTGAY